MTLKVGVNMLCCSVFSTMKLTLFPPWKGVLVSFMVAQLAKKLPNVFKNIRFITLFSKPM